MEKHSNLQEEIDEVYKYIIEEEKILPYDYRMAIGWGVIAILFFIFVEMLFGWNILFGVFITVLVGAGAVGIEFFLMRKKTQRSGFFTLSKKQKFIESIYIISIIFGLLLSILFFQQKLYSYIYTSWIFLISFANFVYAYIAESKKIKRYAMIGIELSVILFLIDLSGWIEIKIISQIVAIGYIGFGLVIYGIQYLLKNE